MADVTLEDPGWAIYAGVREHITGGKEEAHVPANDNGWSFRSPPITLPFHRFPWPISDPWQTILLLALQGRYHRRDTAVCIVLTWEGWVRPCRCRRCNCWCLHKDWHNPPHLPHQLPGNQLVEQCALERKRDGRGVFTTLQNYKLTNGWNYKLISNLQREEESLTTSRTFSPVASHSPATLHLHSGAPAAFKHLKKAPQGI